MRSGNIIKVIRFKNSTSQPIYTIPYFPVGYIYISTVEIDLAKYYGGKWERIKDVFLLAAGNSYKAGATGGETTHVLTVNEMPAHKHILGYRIGGGAGTTWYIDGGTVDTWGGETAVGSTGGSQAHNNMPPYLAVYVYKKVAD